MSPSSAERHEHVGDSGEIGGEYRNRTDLCFLIASETATPCSPIPRNLYEGPGHFCLGPFCPRWYQGLQLVGFHYLRLHDTRRSVHYSHPADTILLCFPGHVLTTEPSTDYARRLRATLLRPTSLRPIVCGNLVADQGIEPCYITL